MRRVVVRLLVSFGVLFAVSSCGGGSSLRNVDVSLAAGPQQDASAAIDPADPHVLLAVSTNFAGRGVLTYSSTDGGATWSSSLIVAPPPLHGSDVGPAAGTDPWVAIDLRGREYCSFVARSGGFFVATRGGPNGRWHVNYQGIDPAVVGAQYGGDDKGSLAVDLSKRSRFSDRVYAAWTRISFLFHPVRFSNQLLLSHSDDGGRTWSQRTLIAETSVTGEGDAYPAMATSADGDLYMTWIAYRQSGVYPHIRSIYQDVLVARSTDGGAHFGRPVLVARADSLSTHTCQRGQTSPAGAPGDTNADPTVLSDDADKRIDVVYARQGCNGAFDVDLASFNPTLTRRLTRRQVNPPDGKMPSDQFLPAAAYDHQTHELWVCYYDTRPDPTREHARFVCQVSKTGGTSFSRTIAAASVASDENAPDASRGVTRGYGEYQAVVAANGIAHPFWTDTRDLSTKAEEIYTTTLRAP